MLAGQNKYWGKTLEEATKIWLNLGIDHLMVKKTEDTPFVTPKGELVYETFKKLGKIQKEYGVSYLIHPYNNFVQTRDRTFNTDSLSKPVIPIYRKILQELDNQIQENELHPLITLHLTVLDYPGSNEKKTEEEGLKIGKQFFQSLELKSDLALETMPDPYKDRQYSLLGCKSKHFAEIIGDRDFALCIDTGHQFMAEEPLKNFLDLPYQVSSLHYNSWVGDTDSHHIPNRQNMREVELVEGLLKNVRGPIVFEIRNYDYSEEELRRLIEDTLKGIVR
jgi:sugar phosphate isomerase/epimerase